jgi:hypothetical protein
MRGLDRLANAVPVVRVGLGEASLQEREGRLRPDARRQAAIGRQRDSVAEDSEANAACRADACAVFLTFAREAYVERSGLRRDADCSRDLRLGVRERDRTRSGHDQRAHDRRVRRDERDGRERLADRAKHPARIERRGSLAHATRLRQRELAVFVSHEIFRLRLPHEAITFEAFRDRERVFDRATERSAAG